MDFRGKMLYSVVRTMGEAMKRALGYSVLGLCLPLLLTGCLGSETTRIRLDLADRTGEVVYSNIVSDSYSDVSIEGDFEGLLEIAYGEQEESEAIEYVANELYAADGHLIGRRVFSIKDLEQTLSEFDIKRDPGKYFMEIDDDAAYIGGNGALVESSSGLRVVWDENTRVIEAEFRYDLSGEKVTSLLPYWEEWQAWDSQDKPDALELLTGQLGDAIETSSEENIIDYCSEDTCYSFSSKLRSPGSFHRLADFAYIYLVHISDDASLDAFKASGGRQMAEIVSRNMLDCPDVGGMENAKCALRNLAATYSIKITFIRYDELDKHETPIDLESELKRTE
jgi:hypothetical protein